MASRFDRERHRAQRPRSIEELAASGVTAGMLRGQSWRRTSRGWYVPTTVEASPTQRILELAPLIPPSGALTGWAAAFVSGVDVLDGEDPWTHALLPATILCGADLGRTRLPLVRYRRAPIAPEDRRLSAGLSLTDPVRTCVEAVLEAPDLVERVVAVDAAARGLHLELERIGAWCASSALQGMARAAEALRWADPRSANPWETRLRMFYRREAGLPKPLVNWPIFDLDENLLGIPDLFDPDAGAATEFDGRDHRQRRQHRDDNLREEGLEGANLVVTRVDSLDFRFRGALARRLRARHEQGAQRDGGRDRWTLEEPEWWRRRSAA